MNPMQSCLASLKASATALLARTLVSLTNSLSCTNTEQESSCGHNYNRNCTQKKNYGTPACSAASRHTCRPFCCSLCQLPFVPHGHGGFRLKRQRSCPRYRGEIVGIGLPQTIPAEISACHALLNNALWYIARMLACIFNTQQNKTKKKINNANQKLV